MVALQKLLRSFSREPDVQSGEEIHVIPLSESPFVDVSTIALASEDDSEKLAPEGSFKAELPLLARAYTVAPLGLDHKVVDLRRMSAAEVQAHRDQDAEEDASGPPAWLGIFFDLAWTATFSNLTNNTKLTTISTLISYTVFFILAWWLWAAQVTYDSKYFRNDWFHRAMLLAQLTIFGSLSAFTKNFSPFSKSVNPKKSPTANFLSDQYARNSMLGISILFASTRVFLIISYARVLYYLPVRNPTARAQRRRLIRQVITYIVSGLMFAMASIVVKYDLEKSAVWVRLFLWVSGVGVEVASYLIAPDVDARLLANMDTMGERLSSLTSIILGEGLNSLAGTLMLSASTLGFADAKACGVAASVTVVITFAFLLYFDGFKRRTPSTRHRSKWNVALHFPLHLSIIILLEALKNGLIYSSITGMVNLFEDRVSHLKNNETQEEAISAALRNIGVDFNQTIYGTFTEGQMENGTAPMDVLENEAVNKRFAQIFLTVLERFDIASDDLKEKSAQCIRTVGGDARTDNLTKGQFTLKRLLDKCVNDIQVSSVWILLSGAVFLACLGLITLVGSWVPRHRYIWGSVLSRWTMAVVLALLSLLGTNLVTWKKLQDQAMLGAIVAIAFVVQFGVDHSVIWIAARRQKYWHRMGSQSSIP